MTVTENILIGDRVRYESAAGTIRGTVTTIDHAKNAAGDVIPWISVEYIRCRNGKEKVCKTRLAETALAMMKFTVIFRDRFAAVA
jgi:hypothetical protein